MALSRPTNCAGVDTHGTEETGEQTPWVLLEQPLEGRASRDSRAVMLLQGITSLTQFDSAHVSSAPRSSFIT